MKTETLNFYSGFLPISHFSKLHIIFIMPHTSPSRIRRKSTELHATNKHSYKWKPINSRRIYEIWTDKKFSL